MSSPFLAGQLIKTSTQRDALGAVTAGTMIYTSTLGALQIYIDGAWQTLANTITTDAIASDVTTAQADIKTNATAITAKQDTLTITNPTGDISTDLMFYNSSTGAISYMSGGQAGTMNVNGTFANLGSPYDADGVYHIYLYDPSNPGNGTCNFAILFPDEAIYPVTGVGGNIVYQITGLRQIQIKSGNAQTYNNMRWRMIKIMQV